MRILLEKSLAASLRDLANALSEVDARTARSAGAYPFSLESRDAIRCAAAAVPALSVLRSQILSVVEEGGYAHVAGLPGGDCPSLAIAIGESLGPLLDNEAQQPAALLVSEVRPGSRMQGSQLRQLDLHTDYSMLLVPPRLTVLRAVRIDPSLDLGKNTIVDAGRLRFVYSGTHLYRMWSTTPLPFAAMNQEDRPELVWSTILQEAADHPAGVTVRFHLSRLRRGFREVGREPTYDEASSISTFFEVVQGLREHVALSEGDLLVIDNRSTLHGRSACSVVVDADGISVGRDTQVLFVTEITKHAVSPPSSPRSGAA